MIILTNKKRNTSEEEVEFGADLSPDDLDVREENELTKEQMNNANHEKQQQENTSQRSNKK
ncbi:hypothetical protein B1B04_08165 [Lysinibacillus sp. KCTC 33748]|uniref:hypothetical protein n=1 Tax=unclassified Lysinibacillus TaxID=2636778 RepID=UPI0009A7BAF9|nr:MULTISPECIES: hypothetical protein [unclassified Lysinibacillus]OXS74859.1 hypothetical protein B1B04_08165 [Lysinibacillus sp. KCTC 33748]